MHEESLLQKKNVRAETLFLLKLIKIIVNKKKHEKKINRNKVIHQAIRKCLCQKSSLVHIDHSCTFDPFP